MMRWQWGVALFWLAPRYRFGVMRAALNYQQFDRELRGLFRAPIAIRRRWPALLALSLLMTMADTPFLVVWFGLSTLLFVGMSLARLLVAWNIG